MAFKLDLDLKLLLTDRYNPAEDSPYKFRQCYTQLVTHRDHLQKQCDAKEQRRANMKHAIRQGTGSNSFPQKPELTVE